MKNILKNGFAILATAFLLASCSNDDNVNDASGIGSLRVEFDNAYGANDLILNTQSNSTSLNEILKIGTVKYIISNIVLTKEDGTTFTYPKNQSYFIINEDDADSQVISLNAIPAGNYTKIKFGIGVDQAQYDLGASGQGDFLALAQSAGLLSGWSEGYDSMAFEGTFTSASVSEATQFKVHTAQAAANYHYNEVTLDLPGKAMVRTSIIPEIHIIADLAQVLDGTNKINLSANLGGTGAVITDGANIPLIMENFNSMFSVNHVHND